MPLKVRGARCFILEIHQHSKLNPKCCAFFQAPYPNAPTDNGPWYKSTPVVEKSLGNLMFKMSIEAALSKRYTNHSLRATCITLLDENGFQSRDICNVTGHRNEKSIRTYVGCPNDKKRQKLSDALSTSISHCPSLTDQPSTSTQSTESMSVKGKMCDSRCDQNVQLQRKKPSMSLSSVILNSHQRPQSLSQSLTHVLILLIPQVQSQMPSQQKVQRIVQY